VLLLRCDIPRRQKNIRIRIRITLWKRPREEKDGQARGLLTTAALSIEGSCKILGIDEL
jgi:hypothetical protein